jgi:excisionase family DNA binding protein
MESLLTPKEVAGLLNCKPSSVYNWAKSGRIPAYKVNGLLRFNIVAIEAWLEQCKIQPTFERENNRPYKDINDVDGIIKNAIDSVKKSGYINPAGDTRLTYKGRKGGM